MKILGYIDDFVSWFVSWQYSTGWWNLIIIPIELIVILWVYFMIIPRCRYP